jgi:hypothetical protein
MVADFNNTSLLRTFALPKTIGAVYAFAPELKQEVQLKPFEAQRYPRGIFF